MNYELIRMCVDNDKYGNGKNPPYSLYQAPNGKWGLVDGAGNKLPADFKKLDEYTFSCVPWEIVCFDEKEGFDLQAWYDPDEVWFNFTFEDPLAYPAKYVGYLWKQSKHPLDNYADQLYSLLGKELHWLAQAIIDNERLTDNYDDDGEFDQWLRNLLTAHPEVRDVVTTTRVLEKLLDDECVDADFRCALWRGKVGLDYELRDADV